MTRNTSISALLPVNCFCCRRLKMQVISQNPQMTQGPPIIQHVAVHAPTSNIHQNYHHKQALWLGITQLVLGMLCVFLQILAIVFGATNAIICAGIWSGVWVSFICLYRIICFCYRVRFILELLTCC